MSDEAHSLLERLKHKARTKSVNVQLLLQLFCQEEFLRRLQSSLYVNRFILKGGFYLYALSEYSTRPTKDIDFLIRQLSNEQEMIRDVILEIIGDQTNQIVHFKIGKIELITERREYEGIRIQMIAHIKNTRTPFDIDLGIDDVIVPGPKLKKIHTQLDGFESPEVYVYSLESTIAEKWDAILERMQQTSRMKDFYDIYDLSLRFSFDGLKLQEAISQTLQKRGRNFDSSTMGRIHRFGQDPIMNRNWNLFMKTLRVQLNFASIMARIIEFIQPPFEAIVFEVELFKQWDPEQGIYINYIH